MSKRENFRLVTIIKINAIREKFIIYLPVKEGHLIAMSEDGFTEL